MPPLIRRQSPERRDTAIRRHLPKAREYWSKWPAYLADDDLCQAGEKAWGAVAQLTKAVAAHRGWQHSDHDKIREVIRAIANESADGTRIARGLMASEMLRGDFYEICLDDRETRIAIDDVRLLLAELWAQLPDEYTGGIPFDLWASGGDN